MAKFHFVYNESVYTTPYSRTGHDFMEDAELLINRPHNPDRLVRLLDEVSSFESLADDYDHIENVQDLCQRRIYSLTYRINNLLNQ